ncbi:MAG: DUF7344 domain-containing protein [Halodesulfurarchaeum sp.]
MISSTSGGARTHETGDPSSPDRSDHGTRRDLSRDEIFDLLSNRRRRYVLRHLKEKGPTSDLSTLSDDIAARENDVDPKQVTSKQRMRAYTALRQSHLPKMDRSGVVDFDTQSGDVHLTDAASDIDRYLESIDGTPTRWVLYYLGVGGIGFLVSAWCLLDIFPLGGIPDAMAGFLLSILVVSLALFHRRSERHSSARRSDLLRLQG